MVQVKKVLPFFLLVFSVGVRAESAEKVLWPSAGADLKAQRDSTIAVLKDGTRSVVTGTAAEWPGMRLDFAAGEIDLSDCSRIRIAVSNTTVRAIRVALSVKAHVQQGGTPYGETTLAPRAAGAIDVSLRTMPWRLDAPLELVGMRGSPKSGTGSSYDLRRVYSFHIYFDHPTAPSGFSVSRISVWTGQDAAKTLSAANFLPFVDRYGQFAHDTWRGKVSCDADLQRARADEDKWLAAHRESPISGADRFGGWGTGPQLKSTGFFRTEKVDGKWWFVDPDGHLFFSHGVDCVSCGCGTGVTHREGYFAELPPKDDTEFGRFWGRITWPQAHGFYKEKSHLPYETFDFIRANARRKYGAEWYAVTAKRAHERLHAWGLNTIANWSDAGVYRLQQTPYTLGLSTHDAPRLKDSTGWWGALPDPFAPEFETRLRAKARAAAAKMKDDPWCLGVFVDNELSWNKEPRMADVGERYFSVVSRILKEELPNHLYLGCRIAWGESVIYRLAARYCDVVSVNIYMTTPVRDLPEGADDKPMIIGEFHFGALDRGLFHTGLVPTRDQDDRAAHYRAYVESALDHPRFIGTHWFQWQDQPLTGRGDGENYQIGFLTVADTPYPELVRAAREVASEMYLRRKTGPIAP